MTDLQAMFKGHTEMLNSSILTTQELVNSVLKQTTEDRREIREERKLMGEEDENTWRRSRRQQPPS